jgi:hypothetical protein
MLISVLLEKPWQSQWQPSLAATKLGYTPMTLSRSVKELVAADIAKAFTIGKSRFLKMERSALQTWNTPSLIAQSGQADSLGPRGICKCIGAKLLAGLSALSAQSMLAEPKYATYAVGPNQWKLAKAAGVRELPEAEPGAREWQLWGYEPLPLATPNVVDPLSLILSLQGNNDERILLALDELKEQIQW